MNNYKGPMVPWEVIRKGIHLGYNYNIENNDTEEYDFICSISNEDLNRLNMYSRMKREVEEGPPSLDLLSWTEIVKLSEIEKEYRMAHRIEI